MWACVTIGAGHFSPSFSRLSANILPNIVPLENVELITGDTTGILARSNCACDNILAAQRWTYELRHVSDICICV